jgi:hypothetical protein
MNVDDKDRAINKYNSDMENNLAAARRVYDSLSDARKLLLEQLLRKLVVCTKLLELTLPAARMNIMMLDFDNYGQFIETDMRSRPDVWTEELKEVFSGPNIPMMLKHIYLAVRSWNRGESYTPKSVALDYRGRNYPVRPADLANHTLTENIERLVTKANEPLSVKGDLMANPSPLDEDGLPPALVDSFD